MVGFEHKLVDSRRAEWRASYLDYAALKLRIKEIMEVQGREGLAEVETARKYMFSGALDAEIRKVLDFFVEQCKDIEGRLARVERAMPRLDPGIGEGAGATEGQSAPEVAEIESQIQVLHGTAQDICALLEYVSLSMQGVRKILKKFAKHVEPIKPSPGYLCLEIEHPHEPGWKMLQGTFLPAHVAHDLDNMQSYLSLKRSGDRLRRAYSDLHAWRAAWLRRSTFDLEAVPGGEDLHGAMEQVLAAMDRARTAAKRNASLVHALGWNERRAGIFEPPPEDEAAVATTLGLVLNCLSSGLYMANYQLVLPNIRDYLFVIGVGASAAGLIIGSSDVASIPGTVIYSMWTNRSFKAPLICSGVACLAGNFLYCLGYDNRSLVLLAVARLVTGLGSARTVNRRYIADFTPKAQRTKASAAFVTCSAAGMALGPLLALPLQHFPNLRYRGLSFDPITMGAWIMSAIWVVFLLVTLICFREPPVKETSQKPDPATEAEQPLLNGGDHEGEDADSELEDGDAEAAASLTLTASPQLPAAGSAAAAQEHDHAHAHGHKHPRHKKTRVPAVPTWQSTVQPMLCVIGILWLLKLVQQAYLDSLPLFTGRLYGWTAGEAGLLLAALGISVIPVNTLVGQIADYVSDRALNAAALVACIGGCTLCLCAGRPMWLYLTGGVCIFFSTVVLEGTSMSLCSKVMHPSLASGTWNAGLISTEAGTIGRLCGNFMLSLVGKFTGVHKLTELHSFGVMLFGLLASITCANLAYMGLLWKRMAA